MAEEKVEQEGKKSKVILLSVIIGAVVFLLIIITLVAFLLMGSSEKPHDEAHDETQPKTQRPMPSSKDASLLSIGPLYPMAKPFVVNLISQNGRRYLKTDITLELSNPKLQQEIDTKVTVLQDIIINILSSKSIEEVATTKGKERIKDEILQRINQILTDGFIKNIFFTEFVVQ